MRFSDDHCHYCKGNIIIDVQHYKTKIKKIVYWPYRCLKRFFVRDLEKREIELSNQIQELNKFRNINLDAITPDTFGNLEKCVASMQNKINNLVVPDDFTDDFQFIFDLKHDLNEFEKHYNKIKKLPKEAKRMTQNKQKKRKVYELCLQTLKKEDIPTIEELIKKLPIVKDTFYRYFPIGTNEYDTIKKEIEKIKIKNKQLLRKFKKGLR